DDARTTHDEDVLGAGRLAGPSDHFVEAVHERESGVCGSLPRAMRQDEEGDAERIAAAPGLRGLVRVAAADDGAHPGESVVEVLLVRARGLAARLPSVAPRSAEDPVVQSLTALAQSESRAVVRPDGVAVQ